MKQLLLAIALVGCGKVSGGTVDGPASVAKGSFVWQQNLFGSFPDVVAVADGQLYLGASEFSPLDLGKGILAPAGGTDIMFARFDTDDHIQSSWRHGGTSDEDILGMSIDPFGNPAVAGLYNSTGVANDGGADLPAATSFDGFAASYSDAGTVRWQLPLTASTQLFPRSASTSSNGLTAITGSFSGTLNIGAMQRASAGLNDVFYVALNDSGAVAALATFGGAGDDVGYSVIFDSLGTVILVGTFTGKVTFGTIALDAGTGADVFVVRMSRQGAPMWAIQGGGTGDVASAQAVATPAGDIILAVAYQGAFQMTGGTSVTAVGGNDIALVRVSSTGAVQWTRSFGGAGQDLARGVAVGPGGEIALSGEFNGAATFGGETFTTAGGLDSFVAKYTADGDHVWSHAAGSPADDRGLDVAVDASGAVYDAVSFHGTVGFGGAPLSASGTDFGGVLVKYSP